MKGYKSVLHYLFPSLQAGGGFYDNLQWARQQNVEFIFKQILDNTRPE